MDGVRSAAPSNFFQNFLVFLTRGAKFDKDTDEKAQNANLTV